MRAGASGENPRKAASKRRISMITVSDPAGGLKGRAVAGVKKAGKKAAFGGADFGGRRPARKRAGARAPRPARQGDAINMDFLPRMLKIQTLPPAPPR